MHLATQTDFGVDCSIASMALKSESTLSVGFDDGSIALCDTQSLARTGEVVVDSRYAVVDHCWSHKTVVCTTAGKNILLYDAERQKTLGCLVGHLDVDCHVTQSRCCV